MMGSAVISSCNNYRFRLERGWDMTKPQVCWICLNPSSADAVRPDPSLNKMIGFSKLLGFGSLVLVNLSAYRTANPRRMREEGEFRLTPENMTYIEQAIASAATVICAWGANARYRAALPAYVLGMIRTAGKVPHALKLLPDGTPSHPLYLPYTSTLQVIDASA